MKLKSSCGLVAAGMLIAAASTASAMTVIPVTPSTIVPGGLGVFGAFLFPALADYDFTFATSANGEVVIDMSAAIRGPVAEPIEYSLFSGAPGSGTLIATSADSDSSVLMELLAAGSYYIDVTAADIAAPGEQAAGTVSLTAVPEPAVWSMMLLGMAGLGAIRRSSRRKQALA